VRPGAAEGGDDVDALPRAGEEDGGHGERAYRGPAIDSSGTLQFRRLMPSP
jgi:hypothetical protein